MNELEQIEQRFNFTYPKLYRQLFLDGMLNTGGEYGPGWYAIYGEQFRENPTLLFFGFDFVLLQWKRIIEEIEAFGDTDNYRQIKSGLQFVPFGQTGSGDLYVFQFDRQNGDDVPVVQMYHDYDMAVVLAKNLQDFIFRDLLEDLTTVNCSNTLDGDLKTNAANILRTHRPYLKQSQIEKLEEIYGRELLEYTEITSSGLELSTTGLISQDELEEILNQEIGCDMLGIEFQYTHY
ncbi:MAG: SMI1/KNR4 family protein [Prevotellaceae bacterium]|jgi:hypothetical protein|nr:SMI1/KNR4 family protein [Prevotellaceae bacterium]